MTTGRVALWFALAARLGAQNVAAAGQPPAEPGRFGFSLECVNGCVFVEAGFDRAHFSFKGEPRVSFVKRGGAADAAKLRPGEFIVDVDSFPVTSNRAGVIMASDTTEVLRLSVRSARGAIRDVVLFSPPLCGGNRGLSVSNHEGEFLTVIMTSRTKSRTLGVVGPGDSELPIPMSDSLYRVSRPNFRAVYTQTGRGRARHAGEMRVSFSVVCHD